MEDSVPQTIWNIRVTRDSEYCTKAEGCGLPRRRGGLSFQRREEGYSQDKGSLISTLGRGKIKELESDTSSFRLKYPVIAGLVRDGGESLML